MPTLSRRALLGASLTSVLAPSALAALPPGPTDDAAFQPNTLFLTWHRDPTTTMVVQWIGAAGETADPTVTYRPVYVPRFIPLAPEPTAWRSQPPAARPYPKTDLKVFRAELTGLKPGTDYEFRIGRQSPVYRFRTMPAKATDAIHFVTGGRLRGERARGRQQRPGGPAGPDVRGGRRRPRVRQRAVGRDQPRVHPQLLAAHGRAGRAADPAGHVHRQPRGGRRVREGAREGPVLLRALRRAVPRHRVQHARLRRLPEPRAARHRAHLGHRRRPGRLAGEGTEGAEGPPERGWW
jgi:hypothetical protein